EPARQRETLDGDAVTAKPRAQRLDGGHDAMPDRAVADAELARELALRAPFQEVRDQCGALRLRQGRDRRVDAALELAPEDEDIGCRSDRRLCRRALDGPGVPGRVPQGRNGAVRRDAVQEAGERP